MSAMATSSLSRGDVLLLNNGDIGVIRKRTESKKYDTYIVEVKGKPQLQTDAKSYSSVNTTTSTTMFNGKQCLRIKHKKASKKQTSKRSSKKKSSSKPQSRDFRKLSGEQLYEKLAILYDIINEQGEHVANNKLEKLQSAHDDVQQQIQAKEQQIHALREEIKRNKRYLLLQQSLWTITHPKNIDKTSAPVLLLTYPTFTNSMELFDTITVRFFNLNRDDFEQRLNECQWDIQIKCISLIQQWLRTYWKDDFYYDAPLLVKVNEFVAQIKQYYDNNEKYVKLADMIAKTIQFQQMQEQERTSRELVKKQTMTAIVEEMKSEFQSIDNKKIAQQMTLIDFENFQAIQPRECLNKNWLKDDEKYDLAPNICEMIDSMNKAFKWTQITILLSSNIEKRARMIKKYLKICRELLELNNFHSLAAVFGALRSTPIWKLKEAWKLVAPKHIAFYDELVVLFDTKYNMQNLRTAHKQATAPMVPYTGIFLTELVGIEEGNKNSTEIKAINFRKLVMISQSIDRVLIFQKTPYNAIEPDIEMQHFLYNQIYDDMYQYGKLDEDALWLFSKSAAMEDKEYVEDNPAMVRFRSLSNSIANKINFKRTSRSMSKT